MEADDWLFVEGSALVWDEELGLLFPEPLVALIDSALTTLSVLDGSTGAPDAVKSAASPNNKENESASPWQKRRIPFFCMLTCMRPRQLFPEKAPSPIG